MFDLGRTVIDVKRRSAADVCCVLPNSVPQLYVLEDDGEFYIQSEDNLIQYDKYWFDNIEDK